MMADEEIVYGGRIGAKVAYGRTVGGDLVPLMVDDDGKISSIDPPSLSHVAIDFSSGSRGWVSIASRHLRRSGSI